jgi:hypothetical protein
MYLTKTERVLDSTGIKHDPTLSLHESNKEPSGFKKSRTILSWVTTKFPRKILHHVIRNQSCLKYCEQWLLASSCLSTCLCLSVCMYVCLAGWPSARMELLGSPSKAFHKIWYFSIFWNSVEKIQVSFKSDKNNKYFSWRYVHLWQYLAEFYL